MLASMQNIDLLIVAKWVIPIVSPECLQGHAIAIDRGLIVDVLPLHEATLKYTAKEIVNLPDHAAMPGLINAHTHTPMNLFRGLADDLPLHTWLNDHIWPAENRWSDADFVRSGSALAIAEMIRSGTTCFNDMYFFPEITAHIAEQTGIRAVIGLIVIDFPTRWASTPQHYLQQGLDRVYFPFQASPLIRCTIAPHAPYTTNDDTLACALAFSNRLDLPIHIHLHETKQEIDDHLSAHGVRPLRRLLNLGLLERPLIAVHMTQLDNEDMKIITTHPVSIVHCPQSNLKLASGFCPTQQLLAENQTLGLGTDGAASNNDLDMWDEMRTAALLAKAVAEDASAFSAYDALRAATLGGAKALGLDDITGTISPGKAADIIAVDLSSIETQPVYNPVSTLVYAAGRENVTHVWINGKLKMHNRILTDQNIEALKQEAAHWAHRISNPMTE